MIFSDFYRVAARPLGSRGDIYFGQERLVNNALVVYLSINDEEVKYNPGRGKWYVLRPSESSHLWSDNGFVTSIDVCDTLQSPNVPIDGFINYTISTDIDEILSDCEWSTSCDINDAVSKFLGSELVHFEVQSTDDLCLCYGHSLLDVLGLSSIESVGMDKRIRKYKREIASKIDEYHLIHSSEWLLSPFALSELADSISDSCYRVKHVL